MYQIWLHGLWSRNFAVSQLICSVEFIWTVAAYEKHFLSQEGVHKSVQNARLNSAFHPSPNKLNESKKLLKIASLQTMHPNTH